MAREKAEIIVRIEDRPSLPRYAVRFKRSGRMSLMARFDDKAAAMQYGKAWLGWISKVLVDETGEDDGEEQRALHSVENSFRVLHRHAKG